jgi:tripartite-type tricarboxylate transporter receptor subunit TctC
LTVGACGKRVYDGAKSLAAVLFATVAALPAQAQPVQYPVRPVRLVVPFAPGGGADLGARQIAGKLSEHLGQQFVIDNRGGSGGFIGMEITAHAAPDGYTLLFSSASYAAAMATRKASHAVLKSLIPVVEIGASPYALGVHPSLPGSLKGLLDLARDKPDHLSYASPGVGGLTHLATELLLHMSKVRMLHVSYKGAGVAMPDLLAGRTPILMTPPIGLMPYFRSNRLRALAVTSAARMPELPDVPSVADTVPGYVVMTWYGLFAPGGTPRAIVTKLNSTLNKILGERELKKSFEIQGIETTGGTAERLAKIIRDDYERWSKVVKDAGITAD